MDDNPRNVGFIKLPQAQEDKVSALRSALRSAPPKHGLRSRSPLKAAVAQLLPDLLVFRAKGYSDEELAEVMRENGFAIATRTLKRYISEARAYSSNKRKSKKERAAPAVAPSKKTAAQASVAPGAMGRTLAIVPRSHGAAKPLGQPRKLAKDVLGHRFDDNDV